MEIEVLKAEKVGKVRREGESQNEEKGVSRECENMEVSERRRNDIKRRGESVTNEKVGKIRGIRRKGK